MHQQVDALRHGHTAVQKFLRSRGGQLLGMEVSVELCNAAAVGDVARMKSLIENGANPNAGDYDDRTGPFPLFSLLIHATCNTFQVPLALGRRRLLQIAVANTHAQVLARAREHATSFALGGI
jgi:hypothetical protein